MASNESPTVPGKTLGNLKVVELRSELEKRGLDKTGVKSALIERLSKVLEEDGEDPETFEFETSFDWSTGKGQSRVIEDSNTDQTSFEEEEKEESIDPDALQLSIEDEEKLLNEEDENYDKSRDDTQVEDCSETKDSKVALAAGDEEKASAEHEDEDGHGECTKRSSTPGKKAEEGTEVPASAKKTKSTSSGKDTTRSIGKTAKDTTKKTAGSPTAKGRNLWVSGLSSSTRAAELKALFSKHGKVVAAKIVTNARTPGARCYGFITMGTLEQATRCIQHLHCTELHGKLISIERTKHEPGAALKRSEAKTNLVSKARTAPAVTTMAAEKETKTMYPPAKPVPSKKTALTSAAAVPTRNPKEEGTVPKTMTAGVKKVVKKETSEDEVAVIDEKTEREEPSKERSREKRLTRERSRERRPRSRSQERLPFVRRRFVRPYADRAMVRGSRLFRRPSFFRRPMTAFFRSRGNFRTPFGMQSRPSLSDTLAFRKMKENNLRSRERDMREEERRSYQESLRQKELERRQREEAYRLEREREHLRIEREKLEREKLEVIRLEREKQRVERERIHREREELRRRQLLAGRVDSRVEPSRRLKRPVAPERRDEDLYWADKKRTYPSRPDYATTTPISAKLPHEAARSTDRDIHHFSSSHHHSSSSHHHSSQRRHHTAPASTIANAPPSTIFAPSNRSVDYRSGQPAPLQSSVSRRSGPPGREDWRPASDSGGLRREHRFSDSGAKATSYGSSSGRSFQPSWSKTSTFSSSQQWDSRKDTPWNGSGDDGRWKTGGSAPGSGYGGGVTNGNLGSHGTSGSFGGGDRYSGGRRY